MKIIDAHAHIYPEKIAEKAASALESIIERKLRVIPTADNLLKKMDEAQISKSVVACVSTRPEQTVPINNWLFSIKNDRFIPFACLHPFYKGYKEEIKRIKENAAGIKMQPEIQNFFIDAKEAFYVFEEMQKLSIPLLLHCGREYLFKEEETVCASPKRLLKVIKEFPNLKIIAAHLGGFAMWRQVIEKLEGEHLYFDSSCALSLMGADLRKAFFGKFGFDKIFYGSDYPMAAQKDEIEFIKNLELSEKNKEKILGANFESFLRQK
ncbi:MAG: amidohydrolase family protein [Elusimicrobiota bacterium]|jgi:predicted TIM-barrel fold metal-dependent hydrolase|nr:amidohydrolase family protein [Elusimicrobiota bacterium]